MVNQLWLRIGLIVESLADGRLFVGFGDFDNFLIERW